MKIVISRNEWNLLRNAGYEDEDYWGTISDDEVDVSRVQDEGYIEEKVNDLILKISKYNLNSLRLLKQGKEKELEDFSLMNDKQKLRHTIKKNFEEPLLYEKYLIRAIKAIDNEIKSRPNYTEANSKIKRIRISSVQWKMLKKSSSDKHESIEEDEWFLHQELDHFQSAIDSFSKSKLETMRASMVKNLQRLESEPEEIAQENVKKTKWFSHEYLLKYVRGCIKRLGSEIDEETRKVELGKTPTGQMVRDRSRSLLHD